MTSFAGMEALGTALTMFEDALASYSSNSGQGVIALTTQEEAEFVASLQGVIDQAYNLQDQCEHLFLHQVPTALSVLLHEWFFCNLR